MPRLLTPRVKHEPPPTVQIHPLGALEIGSGVLREGNLGDSGGSETDQGDGDLRQQSGDASDHVGECMEKHRSRQRVVVWIGGTYVMVREGWVTV
jgi:hypothetical protein